MSSKKNAILIGYITIVFQSVSSIVLTSFYIKYLGYNKYGIYQMVYALANYVLLFDFGIALTVMRFRMVCKEKKDVIGEENLLTYCIFAVFFLSLVIVGIGTVLWANLGSIYSALSNTELILAKKMLVFMIVQIILTFFEHYFTGIAMSEEKYSIPKIMTLSRVVSKLAIVAALLMSDFGVMAIVGVDFALSLLSSAFITIYCFTVIKFKIRFHFFDKKLVSTIALLMFSLMLQSVATFVNNSVGKTVIGIMVSSSAVAIYSVAVTLNSFFLSVPNSMNSVYLPEATKCVVRGANGEELTDFVIKPGRIQFAFCGAVVAGFILFGRQFITLWIGEEATAAWICTMILIVSNLFPMVQNVCLSILIAMNKRLFRSLIVASTSVINIVITVLLVGRIGIAGAAVGTCVSIVLGNIIATNIYYQKVIHLNVFRMYKEIFKRTLLCIIAASFLSLVTFLIPLAGLALFLVKCLFFITVYAVLMLIYGFNDSEKKLLMSLFKNIIGKGWAKS